MNEGLIARNPLKIALLSTHGDPFLGYHLQNLLGRELDVCAVIMDSKGASARDLRIHEERTAGRMPIIPLENFEEKRVPFYLVKNHSSKDTAALVAHLDIDILVNAGTPRILKQPILLAPKIGVISCHPGLLPQFRGCTCVEWAIFLDEAVGNTVHLMSEGIDEGQIVAQQQLSFKKSDRYVDVRVKVYQAGLSLIATTIDSLNKGLITPSDFTVQSEGRYFKPIDEVKLKTVVDKLEKGQYLFQTEEDSPLEQITGIAPLTHR